MENTEKYSAKVKTNELLAYQRDLKEEKEFLEKMLTKIDDQIHRLQVEQLHLLGLMNKSLKDTREGAVTPESITDNQEESTSKFLDLSVANTYKYFEEEVEEMEDDDI